MRQFFLFSLIAIFPLSTGWADEFRHGDDTVKMLGLRCPIKEKFCAHKQIKEGKPCQEAYQKENPDCDGAYKTAQRWAEYSMIFGLCHQSLASCPKEDKAFSNAIAKVNASMGRKVVGTFHSELDQKAAELAVCLKKKATLSGKCEGALNRIIPM